MKNIKSKISELKSLSSTSMNFIEKMDKQEKLFDELKGLARKENTLLGRIVKFPAADSYAVYVIDKVNPKSVHLSWIDYCDGWCDRQFGQTGGNWRMAEAKANMEFEDYLDSLK